PSELESAFSSMNREHADALIVLSDAMFLGRRKQIADLAATKLALPVTALVAVVVATVIMWVVMVFIARGGSRGAGGLLNDMLTRFMGLIVIAMGVQFALTGFHNFFG